MLTSAFGASIAASMATAYGCGGVSSGRISTGVWQLRTKSRVTVQTKSALVRYILVRNLSTISIVMSDRRLTNSGPQPAMLFSYEWLGSSGRNPLGCANGSDDTIRCPLQKVPNQGASNAEAHHHELVDSQMIHHTDMIIGIGIPRPIDLERAGGLAVIGVTHVREDAAVLSLELLDRIKRPAAF